MSGLHDSSVGHLQQIGALIVAAQGIQNSHGYTYDAWEVNESQLKLIRHGHVQTEKGNARSSNRSLHDFASTNFPIDLRKRDMQDVRRGIDCHYQGQEILDFGKHAAQ